MYTPIVTQDLLEEIRNYHSNVLQLKEEVSMLKSGLSDTNFKFERRFESFEGLINKKKKNLTEAQQILIFHYLGLLDVIIQLPIDRKDQARIVSELLKTGLENTKKYLRNIGVNGSLTYTKDNYEALVEYFHDLGLKNEKLKCAKILDKIKKEK